MTSCPFCSLFSDRILLKSELSLAFLDGYPVSAGHALIIPRRHVSSLFALSAEELGDAWKLVEATREILIQKHRPDGFNIGVNDGEAAGQTVGHAHIHVIPRYTGDVPEPRGGIRWVIPGKAAYWSGDQ